MTDTPGHIHSDHKYVGKAQEKTLTQPCDHPMAFVHKYITQNVIVSKSYKNAASSSKGIP